MAGGTKLYGRILTTGLLLALCPLTAGAQTPLPTKIVQMLRDASIPEDAMGAIAIRLSDGAVVLSHGADRSLQPASTMKLVTTLVGLETLGPTKRWQTEFRSAANIEDGVLQGDLILKGGADGDLTWDAFYRMLQSLRYQGIREIRGNLVLDRSLFQPSRTDIGVPPFDEEPEFQYNVIPDALLINSNLVLLDFTSDKQMLAVRMTPNIDGIALDLRMKLIDGVCKDWEDGWKSPQVVNVPNGALKIQLLGTFPRNCTAKTEINVVERNDHIDRLFRTLWTYLGGTFRGSTRDGIAPANALVLAEHASRTLADTLREINKPSDNLLARLMYLTLGTVENGPGTTLEKADQLVRTFFQKQGIDDTALVFENGSGLSRSERIKPSQLAALLVAAYRSNWAPEFLSSLPVVGLDGTMRRRLRESPATGRARMKTGFLNNVAALAGYVPAADGQTYVVVAMINHKPPDRSIARDGQPILDTLVDLVARSADGVIGK